MNRKRFVLYSLLIGLAIALCAGFYGYQEYLGEDPIPDSSVQTNPLVNEKLRAVITKKSVRKIGNAQKLVIDYTDLANQQAASLTINDYYAQAIQLGDTLTKDKGEKMMLVYRKNGKIETVPID